MSSVSYVPKKETIVVKCTEEVAELLRRMEFIIDDDEGWSCWLVAGTQIGFNGEIYAEINVGEIREAISRGAMFKVRRSYPRTVITSNTREGSDREVFEEIADRILSQYYDQLEEVDG